MTMIQKVFEMMEKRLKNNFIGDTSHLWVDHNANRFTNCDQTQTSRRNERAKKTTKNTATRQLAVSSIERPAPASTNKGTNASKRNTRTHHAPFIGPPPSPWTVEHCAVRSSLLRG